MDTVGWYSKNLINGKTDETIDLTVTPKPVGYGTHEVGKKAPNALGLYDMSGNVYEWCYDWYNDNISAGDIEENGFVNNPVGPSEGVKRVRRGGSYSFNASFASVTYRNNKKPDAPNNMGFRLVRNAE